MFLLLGLMSGFLSGLLGIGGGVITVPVLYYLLGSMQASIATSLAAIVVTTSVASFIHYRKGQKALHSALGYLLPGLIIGCISGAELAHLLPTPLLRTIFGIVAIFLGIYFAIPHFPIPKIASRPNPLMTFFGLLIGHLSSFLGIGGGIFTIPLLLAYHIPIPALVMTSSLATLATSLIGTITYLVLEPHHIYLPALISISLGSICTTPLGVKLAHSLPAPTIRRIFGWVLAIIGLVMCI